MAVDQNLAVSKEVVPIYLRRLERLRRLRNRHEQELNKEGVRLLNRTIFETYCVLRTNGAEDRAQQILFRNPVTEIVS